MRSTSTATRRASPAACWLYPPCQLGHVPSLETEAAQAPDQSIRSRGPILIMLQAHPCRGFQQGGKSQARALAIATQSQPRQWLPGTTFRIMYIMFNALWLAPSLRRPRLLLWHVGRPGYPDAAASHGPSGVRMSRLAAFGVPSPLLAGAINIAERPILHRSDVLGPVDPLRFRRRQGLVKPDVELLSRRPSSIGSPKRGVRLPGHDSTPAPTIARRVAPTLLVHLPGPDALAAGACQVGSTMSPASGPRCSASLSPGESGSARRLGVRPWRPTRRRRYGRLIQ